MRRALGLLLLLLLLAGAAGEAGWLYLERWLAAPLPLREPAVVTLAKGDGVDALAAKLAGAGVVDRPWLFKLGLYRTGGEWRLKAGEYRIDPGLSPLGLIDKLVRGEVLLHRIAVAEGLTVKAVFDQLLQSDVLAGDLPGPPPEGTLMPETYLVPRGEPRARLVERMTAAMRAALDAAWAGRAPGLPFAGPNDALTLASIIEKETARPDEYPRVASVFVNRLERGMRLQTDPSVIYGLTAGQGGLGRPLTVADLGADHPWNTYKVGGLPPTPIANPGRAALDAALHPAATDFLFFVADGTGGHVFAATLAEHNRNVARWRRLQRGAAAAAGETVPH